MQAQEEIKGGVFLSPSHFSLSCSIKTNEIKPAPAMQAMFLSASKLEKLW